MVNIFPDESVITDTNPVGVVWKKVTATALNDTGPLESVTRLEETRIIAPAPREDVVVVEIAPEKPSPSEPVSIMAGVLVGGKSEEPGNGTRIPDETTAELDGSEPEV